MIWMLIKVHHGGYIYCHKERYFTQKFVSFFLCKNLANKGLHCLSLFWKLLLNLFWKLLLIKVWSTILKRVFAEWKALQLLRQQAVPEISSLSQWDVFVLSTLPICQYSPPNCAPSYSFIPCPVPIISPGNEHRGIKISYFSLHEILFLYKILMFCFKNSSQIMLVR